MYVEGDNTGRPTGSSPQNEAETSGYSSRVEAETSGYSSRVEPEGGFDHEEDDYQNNPPFYDNIWELSLMTSRHVTLPDGVTSRFMFLFWQFFDGKLFLKIPDWYVLSKIMCPAPYVQIQN